jgi:hypothetical protein
MAQAVFHEFRAYQRTQPILNLAAFVPLPRWMPRLHRRTTRAAAVIRQADRGADGGARGDCGGDGAGRSGHEDHDDAGPGDGRRFTPTRWSIRWRSSFWPGMRPAPRPWPGRCGLLADASGPQERVAAEAAGLGRSSGQWAACASHAMCSARRCGCIPPVPMMVRETTCPEDFRGGRCAGRAGRAVALAPAPARADLGPAR